MNIKTVYLYDVTGVFLGPYDAQESPREPGNFIEPILSTSKAPPICRENEIALFTNGEWEIVVDYRGTVYWDISGDKFVIDEIGLTVPIGGSLIDPNEFEEPPISITPRQGIEILIEYDLYDLVLAYLNSIEGKEGAKARNRFEKATEYLSNDPLVLSIATAQGMSLEQIKQMFNQAKLLP